MALLTPIVAVGTLGCVIAKRNSLKPIFLDILLITFMLFILLRDTLGWEYTGSLRFVIFGICLYYLAAITVQNRVAFKSLVLGIVLITLLCVIYGFIEYAVQDNFFFRTEASRHPLGTNYRIYSTLENPVIFGAFLVQVLPFSLLLFLESQKFWPRLIAIITFMWTIVAILLTFSKGSWIAAAIIVCILLIYLVYRQNFRLLPFLSIVAVSLVVVAFFWPQISNELSVRSASSVIARSATWDAAAHGITDNFWGGVGFNRSALELDNYLDPELPKTSFKGKAVDNAYLSFFMEEGVVGFLLWLGLLSTTIMLGIKTSSIGANHSFWAFAALASVTGFAINSFTFDSYQYWDNIMFFWISAGIIRGTHQINTNYGKDTKIIV